MLLAAGVHFGIFIHCDIHPLIAPFTHSPIAPLMMPECPSDIRSRLQDAVDRGRTPGLQYVAVDATRIVCAGAVGWADLERRVPMDLATSMMAYSMSKTITAVAVLQLVEAGRIDLDAPVTRYVDGSPYGEGVSARQLIAHTGGLPNPIPL